MMSHYDVFTKMLLNIVAVAVLGYAIIYSGPEQNQTLVTQLKKKHYPGVSLGICLICPVQGRRNAASRDQRSLFNLRICSLD